MRVEKHQIQLFAYQANGGSDKSEHQRAKQIEQ